jgi:hypothetical protein
MIDENKMKAFRAVNVFGYRSPQKCEDQKSNRFSFNFTASQHPREKR